jgi:LAS superfamily LD-carboxypeptidase LdcB
VTDSYRSYEAQVDVFARKPQLAAVPGTSRHGFGVALDLGCGVESFGTEAHRWMQANGPRFGWVHPSWAAPGGSMPEPWHWEHVG